MGILTMNADQLSRAADLSASSADLSMHDTAIMVDWATSKTTILCPLETVAAYLRANGITADGTPSTYAAMARWGKHYCRVVNYKPAVKTPELAAAAGITAAAYVPPRRVRAARAVAELADSVANLETAISVADDALALAAVVDAVTDEPAAPVSKRAKRRAKMMAAADTFADACVTGNPADFARE